MQAQTPVQPHQHNELNLIPTLAYAAGGGLGVLPLLTLAPWIIGGIGAAAALSATAIKSWEQKKYDAYKSVLQDPAKPPAPAAPQTLEQMTQTGAWTPETMYRETAKLLDQWRTYAIPDAPAPDSDRTLLYVAAGLGAGALLLTLLKK